MLSRHSWSALRLVLRMLLGAYRILAPLGIACRKKTLKFCETPDVRQLSRSDSAIKGREETCTASQLNLKWRNREERQYTGLPVSRTTTTDRAYTHKSSRKAVQPPCMLPPPLHISLDTSRSIVTVARAFPFTGFNRSPSS